MKNSTLASLVLIVTWPFHYVQADTLSVITEEAELRKITDTYRSNLERPKDFIPQGNGTVIDKRTGLQWMRCALGQQWDGKKCTQDAKRYTYAEANQQRLAFAGNSDWRLPTRFELETLIFCRDGKDGGRLGSDNSYWLNSCEGSHTAPAFSQAAFPYSAFDEVGFWAWSPDTQNGHEAWNIHFVSGFSNANGKQSRFYVRLVRVPK